MVAASSLRPFAMTLDNGDCVVPEALARVLDGLKPLRLDLEEASTVEIVLAEALNNVVEHAYAPPESEGPIHIACRHLPDGLHFRIEDEGKAMPEGQLPLGAAPDINQELCDLPEGGFGWFLIRDLAKDVRYARIGCANRLDLRLAIAVG